MRRRAALTGDGQPIDGRAHCGRRAKSGTAATNVGEPVFDARGVEIEPVRAEGDLTQWVVVLRVGGEDRRGGRHDAARAAHGACVEHGRKRRLKLARADVVGNSAKVCSP